MDLNQLISFLGHSSAYPPFDEFLDSSGIKKRPKGNDDPLIHLYDPTKAVALRFLARDSFDDDVPEGPKSEGKFILGAVDIDKKFNGQLPFGLTFLLGADQVATILGISLKMTSGPRPIGTYLVSGLIVVVRFEQGGKSISSLLIVVKTKYDVKNLGI